MGRRCITATDFNKDENWYLSEAMRMLKEANKLMKAKGKVPAAVAKKKSPKA